MFFRRRLASLPRPRNARGRDGPGRSASPAVRGVRGAPQGSGGPRGTGGLADGGLGIGGRDLAATVTASSSLALGCACGGVGGGIVGRVADATAVRAAGSSAHRDSTSP